MGGREVWKGVLPLMVLAAGIGGLLLLSHLKKAPARHPVVDTGVLVEVMEARPVDHRVVVKGTGVVRARRKVDLFPQVSGRVVWVSPRFIEGGRFSKGERILQIERADYLIALEDAEARLSKALQDLEVARNRSQVERRQWKRLHPDGEPPPTPLVFFEPQLKAAQAAVRAAKAAREKARLDLARTEIKAPFDCRVVRKLVDVGSVVGPATKMGVLLGERMAEAVVPLPSSDLQWLKLPAEANCTLVARGSHGFWRGRALELLPVVDEAGRMPRLLVEIPEPFTSHDRWPVLAEGSFVEVAVKGALLKGVYRIPASALRRGHRVWLAGRDDRLHVVLVEVIRRQDDWVVVKGLHPGDRVITTLIQGAAPGMKLRVADGGS